MAWGCKGGRAGRQLQLGVSSSLIQAQGQGMVSDLAPAQKRCGLRQEGFLIIGRGVAEKGKQCTFPKKVPPFPLSPFFSHILSLSLLVSLSFSLLFSLIVHFCDRSLWVRSPVRPQHYTWGKWNKKRSLELFKHGPKSSKMCLGKKKISALNHDFLPGSSPH